MGSNAQGAERLSARLKLKYVQNCSDKGEENLGGESLQ